MKRNNITIILILLVVTIWGIALYRIIYFSGGTVETKNNVAITRSKLPKDIRRLIIDYLDPFAERRQPQKVDTVKKKYTPVVKKITQPINKPDFVFCGFVQQSCKKEKSAIIIYNDNYQLISIGDSLEGYKVIAISNDTIKIYKDKAYHTIVKKNN